MRFSLKTVCVLIALAGGGAVLLDACGGVADNGFDAGKAGGGGGDATPDQGGRSCEPLPGCTSTTTCPSDCNACTCFDGNWACTAIACNIGRCCPPDPQPACCMQYGGWSDTGMCGQTCDGMPAPGDPAWHLVIDSHGCSMWSAQGSAGPLCGQPFDGGLDGPVEAARDTGGACVSTRGGRCGGNTAHPCSCADGLVCTPGDSGLPFGDAVLPRGGRRDGVLLLRRGALPSGPVSRGPRTRPAP